MESNPLECDICYNVFSQENCPRNLPCSHTFCGPCINGIIATQKKTCPSCRVEFTAASAEDLTINRIALDAAKKFGSVSVKPKTSSKGPKGSFVKLPEDSWNKLTEESFQEKETRVLGELRILEEMKNVFAATETLKEMRDGVLDTQKDLRRFKTKFREIELSNEQILDKIKKGEANLQAATDLTLTKPYQDADEKVNKIRDIVLETQRERDDITEDIVTIKKRLGKVAGEIERAFGVDPPVIYAEGDFPPTFAAKVIEGKQMVDPIKVNQVQLSHFAEEDVPPKSLNINDTVTMRKQLARFAWKMQKVIEGTQMVAPVKVMPGNQVQLSHFAGEDVPPKSLIINHEALMERSSRRAFLDLAVYGTLIGRLVIKVMDESYMALNFLHLCRGDLGSSYANSQFSRVEWKGQPGERIWVDGYITSGNTRRKAAVTKVDWNKEGQREIYKDKSFKVGEVRGFLSDGEASRFCIVTRDYPNPLFYKTSINPCFGIVEEGLDVLRDVILRYPDIRDVRIVNCGLLMMSE